MKILGLNLYTDKLEANKAFYLDTLGFELAYETQDSFGLRIGWSELTFIRSEKPHTYHYCFLVPRNQLAQALEWMQQRTPILEVGQGKKIQRFDSWNADSFYFHDGSGNLAECIARHELPYENEGGFSHQDFLCLNEIGMPTADIPATDGHLTRLLGTSAWKGDLHRFGTHGDQEGLFLLPNYRVKTTWFPTEQRISPEPFKAQVGHQGKKTWIIYDREQISAKKE